MTTTEKIAIAVASISFIVSILGWIFDCIKNSKSNKRIESISADDRANQDKLFTEKNKIDVVTEARKVWLIRLKDNTAKYLSLVDYYFSKTVDINFEELEYYRFLITFDLNPIGDKEKEIYEMMNDINFAYQTSTLYAKKNKKLKADEKEDLDKYEDLFTAFQHKMPDIFTPNLSANQKKIIMSGVRLFTQRIKYGADLLSYKFILLFKTEWEKIKQEANGQEFDYNSTYKKYEIELQKNMEDLQKYYDGEYLKMMKEIHKE